MTLPFTRFSLALCVAFCGAPAPVLAADAAPFATTLQSARDAYDRRDYHLAATLYDQVVRENPVNPAYWRALAAARYLAGDYAESIPAYKMALQLRQDRPATLAYFIARAYGKAGDPVTGMRWLRQSMQWGYSYLDEARTDEALKSLGGQPGFSDVLGIVDASRMSRTQGWRYDLAFLARWAKVKTYHPFRTTTGDRWVSGALYTETQFDGAVRALSDAIPSMSDVQIELAFMRLVRALGDGHTELGGAHRIEYGQTLPVKFELFSEGLFVTAADPAYRSLVGAQVLAFDGRPPARVLAALEPYISRDNDYWLTAVEPYRLRNLPFLHALDLTDRSDRVVLRVKNLDGTTADVPVAVTLDNPEIWNELPSPKGWINLYELIPKAAPLYLTRTGENYWFEYDATRRIVYFQYNRVLDDKTESLSAFARRLGTFLQAHDVDKLAIDMRWNNGGDTFLNQPLLRVLTNAAVNRRGHIFVLIGPRTFSAALNAASYFQRDLEATFVGEPTGGKPNSPGDESFFSLPYSGIAVNFSNVYWESGWPYDERWAIAPDIETTRSFAGELQSRDAGMEAIESYPAGP